MEVCTNWSEVWSSLEVDRVASSVGVLLELEVVSGEAKGIQYGITQILQFTCNRNTKLDYYRLRVPMSEVRVMLLLAPTTQVQRKC